MDHKNNEIITYIDTLNDDSWNLSRTDLQKSLQCAQKAEKLSTDMGYTFGLAYSKLNLAWYYCDIPQYKESLNFFFESLALYKEIDDYEGMLKAYAGISGVHFYLGEFDTVITYNLDAITIAKKYGFQSRQLTSVLNTAQVYFELQNYEEAQKFALQAKAILEEMGGGEQESIIYNLLGDIYLHKQNYDESWNAYRKALTLTRKSNNIEGITDTLCGMGKHCAQNNNIVEGERYFLEALKIVQCRKEVVLHGIGEFYYRLKEYEKAENYTLENVKLCSELHAKKYLQMSYSLLSKIYKSKKKFEEALAYTEKSLVLEKDIRDEVTANKLLLLSVKAKVEETEREKEIHRLKNIELKKKNQQLEENQKIFSVINSIGQELTLTLDPNKIVEAVYSCLDDIFSIYTFGLAYVDPEKKSIDFKIFIEDKNILSNPSISMNDKNSFAAWAVLNNSPVYISDADKEYEEYIGNVRFTGTEVQSVVYIPLALEEKVIGLLTIQDTEKNAYSDTDKYLLKLFSGYIAVAIENARKHEEVSKLTKQLSIEKKGLLDANDKIKNLASKAHKAGMADIATDILHNVGNSMNSILVSSQFLLQKYNTSPLAKLKKANTVLRQHRDDLQNFIMHNSKGIKLLLYYLEVEKMFDKDMLDIKSQLTRQLSHIEKTMAIVSRLNNHTFKEFVEECTAQDIVNEVIVMKQQELENSQVTLVKNFNIDSLIEVQKVKITYVITSIMENAIRAVRDVQHEKIITLSIDKEDHENLIIAIADNGIGMDQETEENLFGQTNPSHTNSFTLHYCANYMTEMHGKLWGKSDGVGKGSIFYMRIKCIEDMNI